MKIHDYASQGDCGGVRNELRNGVTVDARDERDYTPLACAATSRQADDEMLRLLISSGADVNALVDEAKNFPVELAACSGSLSKTQCLLDAGANVNLTSPKGYTALVKVMYALHDDEMLVPVANLLVKNGAKMDCETDYGESPLSVASRLGRFDAVNFLLNAGADPSPLKWTPLMRTVALGTCEDLEQHLVRETGLDARDRFGRTPWLLAASVGVLTKVELLHSVGVDLNERGRMGETALMICSTNGDTAMVRWLVEQGADIEALDDSGNTALMFAVQSGEKDCVQLLLDSGAVTNHTNQFNETAMSMAANEPIIRLLLEAGEDLDDISTEMKRILLGLQDGETLKISQAEYFSGRDRHFGRSNPEVMNVPFWNEMVRAGVSAFHPRMQFGDTDRLTSPVWCFSRFGISFTELPDGRFVQIGGEHEDSYDPDFCIYNEVVVHDRSGTFEIMGYPENVFPPTDFHSATLMNGVIYIIGRLGYHGTREFGVTPVYCLNCRTWKIEPVATRGDNPGWIYEHKASLDGPASLVVSGGTICKEVDGEEQLIENENRFRLDLSDMRWSCL